MRNTVSARKSTRYAVFLLQRGCEKMEFKRAVSGLSLTSWRKVIHSVLETLPFTLLLQDKCHYLSRLRIVVKVRSSKIVDSNKFP